MLTQMYKFVDSIFPLTFLTKLKHLVVQSSKISTIKFCAKSQGMHHLRACSLELDSRSI